MSESFESAKHPLYLESAVSCTQNSYTDPIAGTPAVQSYGRGAGTMPVKQPCANSNMRDDGTSCWYDAQNYGSNYVPSDTLVADSYIPGSYGKGCCTTVLDSCHTCKSGDRDDGGCLCFEQCKAGFQDVSGICWGCNDPNYEYIGGLCYKKCNPGWYRENIGCKVPCPTDTPYGPAVDIGGICWTPARVVTSLAERLTCPAGNEVCGALCYPKCKDTYHPVGCNVCENSNTCKVTEDYDAGLCYPKCEENFHRIGMTCWANVTTHPRASSVSLPKVVQVVPKEMFSRDALFEGTTKPLEAC